MHSGADVEALTAALNRDIEGDTSTSQPLDSENGVYLTGTNLIPISIPDLLVCKYLYQDNKLVKRN